MNERKNECTQLQMEYCVYLSVRFLFILVLYVHSFMYAYTRSICVCLYVDHAVYVLGMCLLQKSAVSLVMSHVFPSA